MTTEEAIKYIRYCMCEGRLVGNTKPIIDEKWQAGVMAIQALKQEPCEDAISRAEALRHSFQIYDDGVGYKVIFADKIKQLPSVKPQQKTGRWILRGGYWRCSECKEKALLKLDRATGNCKEYMPIKSNYCHNCGAKMESEG